MESATKAGARVAALYDIHGNLPALEAVLADIRREKIEQVIIGGDVLPGPMPRETLARLLDVGIPTQFIVGNGDRVVLGQMRGEEPLEVPPAFREVIRWNAQQLGPSEETILASWPNTLRLEVAGLGEVMFCHATPRNDTEIFTRLTDEAKLAPVFAGVDAKVVVCGHTHMQFDRTVGGVRVVNAGSVGMPFAEPGAYWVLLGPGIQLRRTAYDGEAASARIRATDYPQAEEFAARNVLRPPSEEQMLKAFAGAELK
jgi:putative phosphoesterase